MAEAPGASPSIPPPTCDEGTSDPAFSAQAGQLLNELRKLAATTANAARSAKGPEIVMTLSDVRRTYSDLMLRAARAQRGARGATLGQRLYAARQRAELSPQETATAAGVGVGFVYVAFVIDAFSRRIVGWRAAKSMTTALVLDAVTDTRSERLRTSDP